MSFAGKVALVTGAARGQGRNHAVELARRGCHILAVDICAQINSVPYPMPGVEELKGTVRLVEQAGVQCAGEVADVRSSYELDAALAAGLSAMNVAGLDVVIANAGIGPVIGDTTAAAFTDCLDVMVLGVHNTIDLSVERMTNGGAVVITGSTTATRAQCPGIEYLSHGRAGYHAAKAACVGLMRYYAQALSQRGIRVNIIHPSGVDTPMLVNDAADAYYAENPELVEKAGGLLASGLLSPEDVTRAVLYLCESPWVTGTEMFVDAGCCA
jgi:NAD(P)-dependent dehydrogenase (short-subunit alcohol dehydrogenase family)